MTSTEIETLLPVAIEAIDQIIALVKAVESGSVSVGDAMSALTKLQDALAANNAAADTALDKKFQ